MFARGNGTTPPDDVLRMIFEQLELPALAPGTDPDSTRRDALLESRRTLGRSACVCKAFYGHAVRVLWRHLDDLLPVLRLLSSFTEVGENSKSATYMLCENITSTEFDRLAHYASFVTTVGVRKSGTPTRRRISAATWVHLGRQASGKALLPNLRELSWILTSTECCGLLYIVPPSLTHLTISMRSNDDGDQRAQEMAFRTLLSAVFTIAPDISSLSLETGASSRMAISAAPIARLRHLRTLKFGGRTEISADSLRPLAALEGLQHLVLGSVEDVSPPVEVEEVVSSQIGFNGLETLAVDLHPTQDHMYRHLSSPHLTELKIRVYPLTSTSSFHRTCQAWARAFPSLRTIDCGFFRFDRPEREPLARVISPLFALPTISSFCLRLAGGEWTVGDADIRDISMAWPNLATLELDFPVSRATNPEWLGIASLLDLALHCPQLRKLRLPLFNMSQTVLVNIDNYPLLDHGLQELKFDRFVVEFDRYSLSALLLDRLFPHLELGGSEYAMDPDGGWERVVYSIWLCQRARRQQEQRARPGSRVAEGSAVVLGKVA
ncbi:hypothetical protein C8T65DRAFT_639233 [Cerioporus squamosus]|nr:hypothetical protein C8T65DRAFT_639233 [Cerioporus squamosus]